jgi:hypothetical protein
LSVVHCSLECKIGFASSRHLFYLLSILPETGFILAIKKIHEAFDDEHAPLRAARRRRRQAKARSNARRGNARMRLYSAPHRPRPHARGHSLTTPRSQPLARSPLARSPTLFPAAPCSQPHIARGPTLLPAAPLTIARGPTNYCPRPHIIARSPPRGAPSGTLSQIHTHYYSHAHARAHAARSHRTQHQHAPCSYCTLTQKQRDALTAHAHARTDMPGLMLLLKVRESTFDASFVAHLLPSLEWATLREAAAVVGVT